METTIFLGETEYKAKANALTAMHYKNQFQSDILKDTLEAIGGVEAILKLNEVKDKSDYKQMQALVEGIDTVLIYQLIWAFLKTADLKMTPFVQWMDNIPYEPVTDLMLQEGFVDLLVGNIHRKK